MGVLGIVLLCMGGVLFVIGIAFVFPYKKVSKLTAQTKGVVKNITCDAYTYNKRITPKFTGVTNEKTPNTVKPYILTGTGGYGDFRGDSKKMYHAIYFYTVNGVEYSRAEGPGYSKGIVEKKIGMNVTVHYNPKNPIEATLSSGKVYKLLSHSFIPLGAILVIVGLLFK